LNIRKKGAAIGFTATLLASMVAVIAAPLVSAAVSVTSAGTIARTTTSTAPATFTLTENSANCFTNAADADALDITILDSANGNTVHFVGPVTVTAPGSLGATASLTPADNNIRIAFAGADNANPEQVSVSAKIKADAGAALGAIKATVTGNQASCVLAASATATGTLQASQASGATVFVVNVTSTCPFVNVGSGSPAAGHYFIAGNDTGSGGTTTALAAGQQTLTVGAVGFATTAGQAVTQTVPNCSGAIGSPGTVGNALSIYSESTPTQVVPGENNQATDDIFLGERDSAGNVLASPGTLTGSVTFTIANPAVKFSTAPTTNTNGVTSSGNCSLSLDRHSCSVTLSANGGGGNAWVELENILVDVDPTAVLGSPVAITATASAPVVVDSARGNIVAYVGRVIVGTAAQPTIFIGFNDQATGMMTLTESQAGFFVSGVGGNNTFALCLETGESFTRAPWAVVTAAGTTFKLLSGVVGVSQVQGTLFTDGDGDSCAYWTVYSSSTTGPATIEIRGSLDNTNPLPSGAANGPRLSVGNNLVPGSTQSEILVGTLLQVMNDGGQQSLVSNAIRAFKNSVTVTAATQPFCAPGATDCLLGNVVITETQNGQLKAGQSVFGWILPRSSTLRNDVKIKASVTNDLPLITTNSASGLLVSPVTVLCPTVIPLLNVCVFTFTITQQSFGPAMGQITVSNMHATVTPDAVLGPIQTEWSNSLSSLGITTPPPVIGQVFDSIVSNGTVGSATPLITTTTRAASAVGKTQSANAFSVATKVVHLVSASNNVVTIRIKVDPALIGKSVAIWRATKNSAGVWSAFSKITTRAVGADGYAYYYASAHTAQWNSYRGQFPGDPTHGASISQTVQARWRA